MKTITDLSVLQRSAKTSHASGSKRRKIRRIVRRTTNTTKFSAHNSTSSSIRVPSLGRPNHDEITDTHIDVKDLIPTILHERDGRNDKFLIHCELCTVTFDNEDDAQDFVFHLGGYPSDQLNSRNQFSRLFTIAPYQGRAYRLEIRSTAFTVCGETLQPPLFSGELKMRRFRRNDGKIGMCIKANLFLNVNRALNHQRTKLAKRQDGAVFKSLEPTERAPKPHDNVAPLILRSKEHDKARAEYIKQIMATLCADVKRAARVSSYSGSGEIKVSARPQDFSLRECETCWDIGRTSAEAHRALDVIAPLVREWGGQDGWKGNEGNITTKFSPSEHLVIYRKSDNRLRFEIRHRPTQGKKSYTAESIPKLISLMNEFRQMAAQRINRHLNDLNVRLEPSQRQWDWVAYAQEWGACCGNCESSKDILRLLIRERRIYGGKHMEHISSWAKLKRKACDHGLLRFENGAYHVSMPEGMESHFTFFNNSALSLGHSNETQPVLTSPNFPVTRRIYRE